MAVDRSERRRNRRDKPKDHGSLLQLISEENLRKPPKSKSSLKPMNEAQARYDTAIFSNQLVFGIGPAGTGKTYLAVTRAAEQLRDGKIKRIILTRPAVEAGEELGFLPGELEEKYAPYIRPVRDALEETLGATHVEYLLKSGGIQAAPLAYMRGSTFKDAWIIADEMQNATVTQMKMLLTRIGQGGRMIVNGDPSQCDLASRSMSGLMDAVRRVEKLADVCIVKFERSDIVRSGLVQKIVECYESDNDNFPSKQDDALSYNVETIKFLDDSGVMRTVRIQT